MPSVPSFSLAEERRGKRKEMETLEGLRGLDIAPVQLRREGGEVWEQPTAEKMAPEWGIPVLVPLATVTGVYAGPCLETPIYSPFHAV